MSLRGVRMGRWAPVVAGLLFMAGTASAQDAPPPAAPDPPPASPPSDPDAPRPPPDSVAPATTALTNGPDPSVPGVFKKEEEAPGFFGPVLVGGFVGVGFPRPLGIEGFVLIEKVLGLGLEYSLMPQVSLGGVQTQFWALALDARVFPFRNSFFFGLSAGHQHLSASDTTSLQIPAGYTIPAGYGIPSGGGSFSEQLNGDAWFLNPRIGFLAVWDWGGVLGIDAGVQIPVTSTFSSNLPSGIPIAQEVTNVAHFFTKSALPTVDLLRVGLLF